MKGLVFGGTVKLPTSPHADMHGMVRAVVRTKLFTGAIVAMARLGVHVLPQDLGRTWSVSTSAIESEITAPAYGVVFICPLALAYLRAEHYTKTPPPHAPRATEAHP
jgi:hypothetical protein